MNSAVPRRHRLRLHGRCRLRSELPARHDRAGADPAVGGGAAVRPRGDERPLPGRSSGSGRGLVAGLMLLLVAGAQRRRRTASAVAALVCGLATTQGCSDRSIAKDASASSDAIDSTDEGSSTDGASQTTGPNDAVACHDEPLEPGNRVDYSPCHTPASFPCSSCDEWCAAVGRECAYTAVIMGECPAYVPGPPNITCATPSFGSFQCACQGGEPQPTPCGEEIPDQAAGWWLSGCCDEEVSCVAWCAEKDLGVCHHMLLHTDEACAEPAPFAVECDAAGGAQGPRQCVCEP